MWEAIAETIKEAPPNGVAIFSVIVLGMILGFILAIVSMVTGKKIPLEDDEKKNG